MELLDHLGIERAHLVAYSAGGVYAFEALMAYPDRFVTASLLEPWLPREVPVTVEAVNAIVGRSIQLLQEGRPHDAAREWIGSITGPAFFSCLEVYEPSDGWRRIERDVVPTFQVDLPAVARVGVRAPKADPSRLERPWSRQ